MNDNPVANPTRDESSNTKKVILPERNQLLTMQVTFVFFFPQQQPPRTPAYMKLLLKQQKEKEKADAAAAAASGAIQEPDTQGIAGASTNNPYFSPARTISNYTAEIDVQPVRMRPTGLESAGIKSPAEDMQHQDRLRIAILKFLNTTQIHREVGLHSVTANGFAAEGFNPEWNVYHLRHVCVKGGTDGLYMGLVDTLDPTDIFFKDSLTSAAWNQVLTEAGQTGMFAKHFDPAKDVITKVRHVKGSTFFMNCMQMHIDSLDMHISKILKKFGMLYELSRAFRSNADKAFGSSLFSEAMKTPFANIFMHQCGEPQGSDWTVQVLGIISDHLKGSNLLDQSYVVPLTRPHDPDPRGEASHFICFDDLYTSLRNKWWMQGQENIRNFRLELISRLQMQRLVSDTVDEVQDFQQATGRQNYCPDYSATLSTARVMILQFFNLDGSEYDGNFLNVDDVASVAQSFTKETVSVIRLNSSAPMTELVNTFNSFDIMISPSGDHLTSGIFAVKPHNKAIVEVVTFLGENSSFSNYQYQLGFADYVISSGHLTPVGTNIHCPLRSESEYSNRHCFLQKEDTGSNKLRQSILMCSDELKITSDCRIFVNTDFLKRHISLLFKRVLCRKAAEPPQPTFFNVSGPAPLYNVTWEKEMNDKLAQLDAAAAATEARTPIRDAVSNQPLLWISPLEEFIEHFENLKRIWAVASSYNRTVLVVPYTKGNDTLRICDFLDLPTSIDCTSTTRLGYSRQGALQMMGCSRLNMDGMGPSVAYQPLVYDLGGDVNIASLPIVDWRMSNCVIGTPVGEQFANLKADIPLIFSLRAIQIYELAMIQLDVNPENYTAIQWVRGDPTSHECAEAGNSDAGSALTVRCADVSSFAASLRTVVDINDAYGNLYVSTSEMNRRDLKILKAQGFKVLNAGKYTYTPMLRYVIDLQAMILARVFITWSFNGTTKEYVIRARKASSRFLSTTALPPFSSDLLHSGPEMYIATVVPEDSPKYSESEVIEPPEKPSLDKYSLGVDTSFVGSLSSADLTKVILIAIVIFSALALIVLWACGASRQGDSLPQHQHSSPQVSYNSAHVQQSSQPQSTTPPRNSSSFSRIPRGSSPTSL